MVSRSAERRVVSRHRYLGQVLVLKAGFAGGGPAFSFSKGWKEEKPSMIAGWLFSYHPSGVPGRVSSVATPTPAAEKSEREKRLAIATEAARQLLLTTDTDKSGKVSKQEWMKFMEEEFGSLDVNHGAELDVKELIQSRMRYCPSVGK